jgi:hypothetical protein
MDGAISTMSPFQRDRPQHGPTHVVSVTSGHGVAGPEEKNFEPVRPWGVNDVFDDDAVAVREGEVFSVDDGIIDPRDTRERDSPSQLDRHVNHD